MIRFHEFDPVIYPYKLWIIVSTKPDIMINNFLDRSGEKLSIDHKFIRSSIAFTHPVIKKDTREYGVVIQFNKKKYIDFEIVAHEASHASKFLFEHINADTEPHEPFEYVVGWIAKCCKIVKNN